MSSGSIFKLTPSASRTSAAPHLLDAARLPCFVTLFPVAATIKAAVVDIFIDCAQSPPVPTISSVSY